MLMAMKEKRKAAKLAQAEALIDSEATMLVLSQEVPNYGYVKLKKKMFEGGVRKTSIHYGLLAWTLVAGVSALTLQPRLAPLGLLLLILGNLAILTHVMAWLCVDPKGPYQKIKSKREDAQRKKAALFRGQYRESGNPFSQKMKNVIHALGLIALVGIFVITAYYWSIKQFEWLLSVNGYGLPVVSFIAGAIGYSILAVPVITDLMIVPSWRKKVSFTVNDNLWLSSIDRAANGEPFKDLIQLEKERLFAGREKEELNVLTQKVLAESKKSIDVETPNAVVVPSRAPRRL